MSSIGHLTPAKIARLNKDGLHKDGGGLYLRRSNHGKAMSWVFRYPDPVTGKEKRMGLGSYFTINCDRARQLAKTYREQVKEGKDPQDIRADAQLDAKQAARIAKTVNEATDEYWDTKIASKSLSYRRSAHIELRDYFRKPFGELPIQKVTRNMLLEVIRPTWQTKHVTTKRALGHIWGVFRHAIGAGYYKGENPADREHMNHLLPDPDDFYEVEHFPSIPFEQIGEFMEKFRAHRIPQFEDRQTRSRGLIAGERYGRFIAIRRVENDKWHRAQWLCRCDCGTEKVQVVMLVRNGSVKSCGCLGGRPSPRPGSDYRVITEPLKQLRYSHNGGKRSNISLLIEFIILSGVRGSEARLARWGEIKGDTWNVPSESRKGRKKQKREGGVRPIPITPPMHAVLEEMRQRRTDQSDDALVFPGDKGGMLYESNLGRELRTILRAIEWPGKVVIHGFRDTLRNWSRHHGYPPYLWLIQAGHKAGSIFDAVGGLIHAHSKTDDAYGRGDLFDRRREMMEHWARDCSGPPEPKTKKSERGKVVNLNDRRYA